MLTKDWKKELCLWISAGLGLFPPAYFAWEIYLAQAVPNAPTWLMVFLLDLTGLWVAYTEGNKRPYLQAAWLIGSIIILAAVLSQPNIWRWGPIEVSSSIVCTLAVILWRMLEKTYAAIVGLALQSIAVYISFLPQIYDYWKAPEPGTWYLWLGSALASVAAIYGAKKHDAAHTFIPYAALGLNLFILIEVRVN